MHQNDLPNGSCLPLIQVAEVAAVARSLVVEEAVENHHQVEVEEVLLSHIHLE